MCIYFDMTGDNIYHAASGASRLRPPPKRHKTIERHVLVPPANGPIGSSDPAGDIVIDSQTSNSVNWAGRAGVGAGTQFGEKKKRQRKMAQLSF